MLTRDSVRQMKEDQLCVDVLIPLLKAMGFMDVTHKHGATEKGKDIVCWTTDEFKIRENIALVVKAKPINGKSQVASGTAGEVLMQLQQAFGSAYPDPITTAAQQVNRCWVVTNQEILVSATESIQAALASTNLHHLVRFIDGDKLWELIEQYLVKQTVNQKLQELQSVFSQWDSHYTPNASISGSEIRLSLHEKYPGAANDKPLSFQTKFTFPNTDEGNRVRADFDKMLSKGDMVTIPKGYFNIEDIPEILQPLLNSETLQNAELVIGSANNNHHFIGRLEVRTDDGHEESIDYLDLVVTKAGKDEITFENVGSNSIFHFSITLSLPNHNMTFHMVWNYIDQNIDPIMLYKIVNLQYCLSKPYTFRFVGVEQPLVDITQKGDKLCDPPPGPFIDMVSDIAKIEQKIKRPLILPLRNYSETEVETINSIREIYKYGKRKGRWNNFELVLTSIVGFDTEPNVFNLEFEESFDFFGIQIPLGVVSYVMHDAYVENIETLNDENGEKEGVQKYKVVVSAKNGEGDLDISYLDWLALEN